MFSILAVFKRIFLPYLILGTMGVFLMLCRSDRHKRKTVLSVLFCIAIMLVWRMTRRSYNSYRYSENLFAFFAVCSAYFLCYWHLLFQRTNIPKKYLHTARFVAISVCVFCLVPKFFHYNPYVNYNKRILADIKKDNPGNEDVVISAGNGYPYKIEGIDFYTAPTFLHTTQEEYLLNIIRHYQFRYKTLYIVSESPLERYNLPPDDLKNISVIGAFRKNRRGKTDYVFKYRSPELFHSLVLKTDPSDSIDPNNLLRNSGFETLYPHNEKGDYYDKIQNSKKRGIIPEDRSFPASWDIYYGVAGTDLSSTSVYATKQDAVSGQYSMFVKAPQKTSFLYESPFPKGEYLFQCDLRPVSKSSFGLQLSLRDEKTVFIGFRDLEKISLDIPNQTYRYQIRLTKDMIYPFQKFYLYLMSYEQSELLIDNVSLTKITE